MSRVIAASLALRGIPWYLQGFGAVLCVIVAQGLLALCDSFAPYITSEMSIWQVHVIRSGAMLPLILLAIWIMGTWGRLMPRAPRAVALRTALNVAALGTYFAVLPQMPLAQAAAGLFTAPLWVVLFLALARRRWPEPRVIAASLIGFTGVLLALGTGQGGGLGMQQFVPLAAGALYALSVLTTNRCCAQEAPCSLLFWNIAGFFGLGVLGMIAVSMVGTTPEAVAAIPHLLSGARWVAMDMVVLIVLLGCLSVVAVGLLTHGYQQGAAEQVALFDYSYLIWAAAFSALIWDRPTEPAGLVGLALILLAGVTALRGGTTAEPARV